MRQPQVIVYEGDGKLAALLKPLVEERQWPLREARQSGACLRLLRQAGPAVLVLKTGRDLERDLALLERAAWLRPQTPTVVVGDADHAALAGLAWDLGAAFVLMPPLQRELLPDLVAGLMERGEAMAWDLELPLLNETRCIGCGDCVAICPTGCLEQVDAFPWLPRPLDCVRCGLCVDVCPVDALILAAVDDG